MRNPFRRREEKALTGSATMIDALRNGGWTPIAMLGGGARQNIQDVYNTAQNANYSWQYTRSPALRTVVDLIVRNIGQLDLRLYEEVSEAARKPRPDHEAAMSMRYPNEETTSDGFVRALYTDWLIHNNAYALIVPTAGNRIQMLRIPAYMVEVQGSSLFKAENYRVWTQGAFSTGLWGGSGSFVDYTPENIMHWHGENPHDPRVGLSYLDTVRDVIAEDAALQAAITELAKAGMTEPVWAFRPESAPELGQTARRLLEEDLGNRLHDRNRRPIVLEEGTEFRSFNVSPRDAQMMEVRRWALQRIAAVYGVGGPMVGLDGDLGTAQKQFYADVLPPYCESFTRFLNQRICVRIYDWEDGAFEFNLEEKLSGDDRIRTYLSAAGAPIMTRNETRARLNLKPVDGGDKLVVPLNVQEEGGGSTGKPSPGTMPIQDPNGPDQSGAARNGGPPVPGAGTQSAGTPAKSLEEAAESNGFDDDSWLREGDWSTGFKAAPKLPRFHPRNSGDKERSDANVRLAEDAVRAHLDRVARVMHEGGSAKALGDWQRWNENFALALRRMLTEAIKAEGDVYAKRFGATFDVKNVVNYIKVWSQEAAKAINETVQKEMTELGTDQALARAPQHVASAGANLGVRATTFAREEAARQAPGFQGRVKTWIADTERHQEWDGSSTAVDGKWPSGFAPGTAPGCKCTMSIH